MKLETSFWVHRQSDLALACFHVGINVVDDVEVVVVIVVADVVVVLDGVKLFVCPFENKDAVIQYLGL